MIFHGEFAVGFLDLVLIRLPAHAEDFVVIAFGHLRDLGCLIYDLRWVCECASEVHAFGSTFFATTTVAGRRSRSRIL